MIAQNATEFCTKAADAICKALNNETGQKITEKMLEKALEQNPEMTPNEWQKLKEQFVQFVFVQYMMHDKEAMNEFAGHIYDELRSE